jgi:muramoyltetrapeptide carboxypeptidase
VTGSAFPQLLRPRALRPGDLVVIASLSGPLPEAYEPNVDRTVAMLERMGFRVRRAPLLEAGRQRWWSAATHLVLYARTGLVGFHADMAVPGFGGHWQAAPATRRTELENLYFQLLTGTEAIGALPASASWECWRPGHTEGRLIGGVINRIALAQATPFALPLEWFDGAVLFWEEMGGLASYVWSYLQVLRHSGILDRISGMVVGIPHAITGLETPDASPSLAEIVLDVLGDRDVPVLGNVEVGHAGPNLPMPVGVRVALDAQQRTLSLLEPAVIGGSALS